MARFADQPVVEVETFIAAPVAAVWELVTDINVPARFQDEFVGADWVGDERGLDGTFRGRNERRGSGWETTSWVVEYEPEVRFGWAVSDRDNPGATWVYELAPEDGGTRLVFRRTLGPGPSGLTDIIAQHPEREEEIIERRDATHRANMEAVVAGIKELAEAGGGDGSRPTPRS